MLHRISTLLFCTLLFTCAVNLQSSSGPDLSIDSTLLPDPVDVGNELKCNVTVVNRGTTAHEVKIMTRLDSTLSIQKTFSSIGHYERNGFRSYNRYCNVGWRGPGHYRNYGCAAAAEIFSFHQRCLQLGKRFVPSGRQHHPSSGGERTS